MLLLGFRNSSNRLMGPKMIFLLGFVDHVDRIATSIWGQLVALLESSEPYGRARPEFSYIPLSQCKPRAVCCGERLHVTVFGKIADLSLEHASNCSNIQYFDFVSKNSWMEQFLVLLLLDRVEFPYDFHPPSDSLKWRTRLVFLVWCFSLLESSHFLLLSSIHSRSRRGRCTG